MNYYKLHRPHEIYIDLSDKTISFMDVYNRSDTTAYYKSVEDWFDDIRRTLLYSIEDDKFFYKSVVEDKCTILPMSVE